jgi:hypothetical protein
MDGLVCGLIGSPSRAHREGSAARARDLTVFWLRWNYFGDILEDEDLGRLLARASEAGHRHCLVQGYGHIVTEHSGPNGGTRSAFDVLYDWAQKRDFVFAGTPGRCLLVDLSAWRRAGQPSVESSRPLPFGPELGSRMLDLGLHLEDGAEFLSFLDQICEKASRGVFVLNYEPYDDVEKPPPTFRAPISTLYCVAAGLKPNRILETHAFDAASRVVFFDYSECALDFRRRLDADWDGRDYPAYLRQAFSQCDGAHYFLWPGASPENMDWPAMERLWAAELDRWGGAEAFAAHWRCYRGLRREYLRCDILHADLLIDRIRDERGGVIWWSNAFCTVHTARRYGLEEKRWLYENWIRRLARAAPNIFVYGSDHANISVNGLTARAYRAGYFTLGGDPLLSRSLFRRAIRF